MDRQTEKRTPMSQSQEVREMFHARFDGCLVINVHSRTDGRKSGRLYRTLLQAGCDKKKSVQETNREVIKIINQTYACTLL